MASMRLGLFRAQARGARRSQVDPPPDLLERRSAKFAPVLERQRPLPAAGEFAVDFDQDFRVEQRPVLDAPRSVDPVPVAQGVEAVLLAGMLLPRERQRVDHAIHADRLAPKRAEAPH